MRKALSKIAALELFKIVRDAGREGIYAFKLPMMLKVSAERLLKYIVQMEDIYVLRDGKLFLVDYEDCKVLNDSNSVLLRSGRRIQIPDDAIGSKIDVDDFYLPLVIERAIDNNGF